MLLQDCLLKVIYFFYIKFNQSLVYRRRMGPPPLDAPNSRAVTPDWGTIEQLVDHFNPIDLRTWNMVGLFWKYN